MKKFEIRNEKKDEAELLIYGVVGNSYWDDVDAKEIVNAIRDIEAKTIKVRIYSEGGSIFAGLAIYNALKKHSAIINVEIDALAASIASVIAMAGDSVEMPKNAFMVIHNPWTYSCGEEKDMIKAAEILGKLKESLVGVYNDKTGIDTEDISEMMNVETWLSAGDAIEYGFADAITGEVVADEPNNRAFFNSLENFKKVPKEIRELINVVKKPVKKAKQGEDRMTLEEFKAKYPELYDQLFNLGVEAGKKEAVDDARAEGAENERARIKSVFDQSMPGHEALINELAFDGKTTGPESAVVILNAERKIRNQVGSDLNSDGINPVPPTNPPEPKNKKKINPDLPFDERVKAEWEADPKLRNEFDSDFEAYAAWAKADAAGQIKTFGGKM